MTARPDIWRTDSDDGAQKTASVGLVIVGLLLALGSWWLEGPGPTYAHPAFALGLILLTLGAGVLLFAGRQTITVDPSLRRVIVEKRNRLGTTRTETGFDDIVDVSVDSLGDNEGGSVYYHLALSLKSGKQMALFVEFFRGSHSKAATEARRQRLLRYLQTRPR